MAVAFRSGSNTGNLIQLTSVNAPVPTGAQVNDIAVVHLTCWQSGANPTYTPPTGFTQKVAFTSGDGAARNTIWWKRLTAGDTGNYTFGIGASFWAGASCMLFTGCTTSGDPWDAIATAVTGTFGSITSMSVSLSNADGGLYWCCYNDTTGTHTPPTNFTETADFDCYSAAYRIPGSSGTQSSAGASISSSSAASAWLGALLAVPSGPGYNPPTGMPSDIAVDPASEMQLIATKAPPALGGYGG